MARKLFLDGHDAPHDIVRAIPGGKRQTVAPALEAIVVLEDENRFFSLFEHGGLPGRSEEILDNAPDLGRVAFSHRHWW